MPFGSKHGEKSPKNNPILSLTQLFSELSCSFSHPTLRNRIEPFSQFLLVVSDDAWFLHCLTKFNYFPFFKIL